MSNNQKSFSKENLDLASAAHKTMDVIQHFNQWMGIGEVTQRRWLSRLPAVFVAAVILAMFVWTADLGKADLSLVLALGLLVGALWLQTGVK